MKKMILMTQEIRKKLPELYSNEEKNDNEIQVFLKIFNPYGQSTWYITEFDGNDTMFGLCCIHEAELGYVSLSELDSVRVKGLPLERDRYWKGTLEDAKKEARSLGYHI